MTGHYFWIGLFLSAVLNILATAAALAISLRAKLVGRSERALSTLMVWNFLVMCPVYALGLTNHLDAASLACLSAPFFLLVLAVACGRTPVRRFAAELGHSARQIAVLPFEAIAVCARARSLVTVSVVFTFAVLVWGVGCAYLMPSWKQWDALWYHEPIVGYAIQNHGFAFVDLPGGGIQKINGYPRLGEMTQLWFVIFTDRRVIDLAGYVAAPGLAFGMFLLARRASHDIVLSIAFACALVLTPACIRVIGSTYVDAQNAAFLVAAAAFVTRREFRMRDALLTSVCLSLAIGSKAMAMVPVGVLAVAATIRLLAGAGGRPWATIGTIASGFLLITGTAATTYLRNWLHFGNPFWPDLKYDNPKWGIHWPGLVEWGANQFERGESRIDVNLPRWDFLEALYRIPYSLSLPRFDQMWEYGIGVTWVVVPLAGLSLVALAAAVARDIAGHVARQPDWKVASETKTLVPVALTLVCILEFSPALWSARYQIAAMALALAMVAWLTRRRIFRGVGEGIAGALAAMSIVSFFWMTPRTWLWWSEAMAFARIPYPEREFTPASAISPKLEAWNGSPVTMEAGLAREKELTRGTVLAFSDDFGTYMALFWNNAFSNQALYIPAGPNYLQRLAKSSATWAYCATGDPNCRSLSSPESGWELVGRLDLEGHGSVYRRAHK
jgi:hypothetical protein